MPHSFENYTNDKSDSPVNINVVTESQTIQVLATVSDRREYQITCHINYQHDPIPPILLLLHEMMDGRLSSVIYADQVPVFDGAMECAEEFLLTAAGQKNRNSEEENKRKCSERICYRRKKRRKKEERSLAGKKGFLVWKTLF